MHAVWTVLVILLSVRLPAVAPTVVLTVARTIVLHTAITVVVIRVVAIGFVTVLIRGVILKVFNLSSLFIVVLVLVLVH